MIEFDANWFDGRSSAARKARVTAGEGRLTVAPEEGPGFTVDLASCEIVSALGGVHRTIRLPEGMGHLETLRVAQVETLERLSGSNGAMRLLHRMESRWRFALAALLIGGLVVLVGARWLIPVLADYVAARLPASVSRSLGEGAVDSLDKGFLKPTGLSEERRASIAALFDKFCADNDLSGMKLVFRSIGKHPNAFALPDGTIILTDEMADFALDDDELLGVLAHEAAHVEKRHALRQLLRHVGSWALVTLAVGDASAIVSAAATLPAMLIERGYGRDFELEADAGGAKLMEKSGRTAAPMISLLTRLGEKFPEGGAGGELFSTHPEMKTRMERLKSLR